MEEVEFKKLKENRNVTDLYRFFRRLPKGGLLHIHLTGAISFQTISKYSGKLYVKIKETEPRNGVAVDPRPRLSLISGKDYNVLRDSTRGNKRGQPFWAYKPAKSLSAEQTEELRESLVFRAAVPPVESVSSFVPTYRPTRLSLPSEFEKRFSRLDGLTSDTRLMRRFLRSVLRSLWRDNIEYAEIMVNPFGKISHDNIRYTFGESEATNELEKAEENKAKFDLLAAEFVLKRYLHEVSSFNAWIHKQPHLPSGDSWDELPPKLDVRFLIGLRRGALERRERLEQAFELVHLFQTETHGRYRYKVPGINLIGDEFGFVGRPTDYLGWLLPLRDKYPNVHVSLHAGESTVPDGHVLDSILLGAERIGHGLSLRYSKRAEQLVLERGICMETCILSNKILGFVPDVARHPAKGWIKEGIITCLNTDDPGIFVTTLTDEFYYACLAFDLTLSEIKNLALQGLKSSFSPPAERTKMVENFEKEFDGYLTSLSPHT